MFENTPRRTALTLTLREGQRSGRFIPLVLEALFRDAAKRRDPSGAFGIRNRFCEGDLLPILKQYFPDLDLHRFDYDRLKQICRDLPPGPDHPAGSETHRPDDASPMEPMLDSRNPAYRDLLHTVAKAAASRAPILLTGETGVGKEVLARFIHRQSPRAHGPFVAVNCGAVPENLLESELYGYRKGAFSEAREDKPGLLRTADGGTILLDEIGEMSPRLQVKLLRFLQDHAIQALGAVRPVPVDVRVLASTNRDLDEARRQGEFRDDLFYRLNVFRFRVPALRERMEDLPALVDQFIARYNRENRLQASRLTPAAWRIMMRHSWPGNVRELENTIQRAVILAGRGRISPAHLPQELAVSPSKRPNPAAPPPAVNEDALLDAVAVALAPPPNTDRPQARLGTSIPLAQLARFLGETAGRAFAPREFAAFISTSPVSRRRDKLAGKILAAFRQSGLVDHNGRQAQAARYWLRPEFLNRETAVPPGASS